MYVLCDEYARIGMHYAVGAFDLKYFSILCMENADLAK